MQPICSSIQTPAGLKLLLMMMIVAVLLLSSCRHLLMVQLLTGDRCNRHSSSQGVRGVLCRLHKSTPLPFAGLLLLQAVSSPLLLQVEGDICGSLLLLHMRLQ